MNKSCGCCEGTHTITPVSETNRPGLKSIRYRAGTHASFLETMKARLSNTDFPELFGLTARESIDPSIALLDSWATVADVLTFYQERIANEGYLRTATERRSVLELARLVGYSLKPGVAASVYLAYTLDTDYELTIPAGSRSQSMPTPGELPQSFETSEPLYAKAEWNLLQPRLTKPQLLEPTPVIKKLYLKGISTNLRTNDALLIVFNQREQELFRVTEVTPDATNDRTRVSLEPWLQSAIAPAPIAGTVGAAIKTIREIASRSRDLQKAGITRTTAASRRITEHLKSLEASVTGADSTENLIAVVRNEFLPGLKEEQKLADDKNFTQIKPWITRIVKELDDALAQLETNTSPTFSEGTVTVIATEPAEAIETSTIKPVRTQTLSGLISPLVARPEAQPANSLKLIRDLGSSFSRNSDTAANLLTTFIPELGPVIYKAWSNLPVTKPAEVKVFAFRVKSSVFGNAAPLKPVIGSDGSVIGTEEWTLKKFSGTGKEHFSVTLKADAQQNLLSTVEVAGHSVSDVPTPTGGSGITIQIPGTNVEVKAIATFDDQTGIVETKYAFKGRPIAIQIKFDRTGVVDVNAEGSDPTLVEIKGIGSATGTENRRTMTVAGSVRGGLVPTEIANVVSLESVHDQILPSRWVVVDRPNTAGKITKQLLITTGEKVKEGSRADYGITATGTQITLNEPWLDLDADEFKVIRGTRVLAQSEQLELALEPIEEPVCTPQKPPASFDIELDDVYGGLEPGRWLIVSGERADIESISGVKAAELVMLAGVKQAFKHALPGDKTHTVITLATRLAYCYKRDSVKIYGNVVKATHGESHLEVLGSGDSSKAMQQFELKISPLTFVSASTPRGAATTLEVRVNDILWHEADNLAELHRADRRYIARIDDNNKSKVIFGNGERGARLPTGQENVKGTYRTGIGKPGNVSKEQISLLVTRPLGVKSVINPLAASGGADREGADQARRNAPLGVTALDRLLSLQDYEDFAHTFAGIGKAAAARLTDGRSQLVHVTIAGADDIPIDTNSDLYRNLLAAFYEFGDPSQRVLLQMRGLKLLIISAKVRLAPDYLWEAVQPKIKDALLEHFGFENRELGQDAIESEAVSIIQRTRGVAYVDIDVFDGIDELELRRAISSPGGLGSIKPGLKARIDASLAGPAYYVVQKDDTLQAIARAHGLKVEELRRLNPEAKDPLPVGLRLLLQQIRPAQLVMLTPKVSDTLILTELPPQ
jgi:predicted phage baseplate assembly protein